MTRSAGQLKAMTNQTSPSIPDDSTSTDALVRDLNGDLQLEYQSIVQYINHVATITGPEYTSTVDELKIHLTQELHHAIVLAEQVSFLNGQPASTVPTFEPATESKAALEADLKLESAQLQRYRDRVEQATNLGLPDVAEALRPLLTETQEHVRDLQTALGR
jgi:bacterioferritin